MAKFEKSECFARNEAPGFPMTNLFIGDSRLGCKSDADEQLILHISFQEFVKVRRSMGIYERKYRRLVAFDYITPTIAS